MTAPKRERSPIPRGPTGSSGRVLLRVGRAALLPVLLPLAGCAQLWLGNADPPRVSVISLRAAELSLFEQRFLVGVLVRNPNGFALPISGLDYRLALNGRELASGASRQYLEVPSLGERVVVVPATSTLLTSFNQIRRWRRNPPEALRYRFTGRVHFAGTSLTLPFARSGVVDLSGQGGGEADPKIMPALRIPKHAPDLAGGVLRGH